MPNRPSAPHPFNISQRYQALAEGLSRSDQIVTSARGSKNTNTTVRQPCRPNEFGIVKIIL